MLTTLAVWYLKKKRRSVLIGYNIKNGEIMAKHNNAFLYDNNLTNVEYSDSDNVPFKIPKGKFSYTRRQSD